MREGKKDQCQVNSLRMIEQINRLINLYSFFSFSLHFVHFHKSGRLGLPVSTKPFSASTPFVLLTIFFQRVGEQQLWVRWGCPRGQKAEEPRHRVWIPLGLYRHPLQEAWQLTIVTSSSLATRVGVWGGNQNPEIDSRGTQTGQLLSWRRKTYIRFDSSQPRNLRSRGTPVFLPEHKAGPDPNWEGSIWTSTSIYSSSYLKNINNNNNLLTLHCKVYTGGPHLWAS